MDGHLNGMTSSRQSRRMIGLFNHRSCTFKDHEREVTLYTPAQAVHASNATDKDGRRAEGATCLQQRRATLRTQTASGYYLDVSISGM